MSDHSLPRGVVAVGPLSLAHSGHHGLPNMAGTRHGRAQKGRSTLGRRVTTEGFMHVDAAVHQFPWRRSSRRPAAFLAGAAIVAALLPATLSASASPAASPAAVVDPALNHLRGTVGVIVQAGDRSVQAAESATTKLGGKVTLQLPIVHGFAAKIPADAVRSLANVTGVRAITLDGRMHVQASLPSAINGPNDLPSVYRQVSGAKRLGNAGDNGQGVTVALIDTGVAALPDVANRIVQVNTDPLGLMSAPCMNFSIETTCDDSYGHGTFIAGLLAGKG